jgi:hypothetical protein
MQEALTDVIPRMAAQIPSVTALVQSLRCASAAASTGNVHLHLRALPLLTLLQRAEGDGVAVTMPVLATQAPDFYEKVPPAPPGLQWWHYKAGVPPLPEPSQYFHSKRYSDWGALAPLFI